MLMTMLPDNRNVKTIAMWSFLVFLQLFSVTSTLDKNSDGDMMSHSSRDGRHDRSSALTPQRRLPIKRKRDKTSVSNDSQRTVKEKSATEMVNTLLQFYDKHEAPYKDRPTEVRLGIYINSFYSISEQTMDYAMSMYLRQEWLDPRLNFKGLNSRLEKIRMPDNIWERIWIPDTFFRNEKNALFHEVTVKNRLVRLSNDGTIWYVTKISATLSCPMSLHKYPLDEQSCPMMFESFGYTMDTLRFSWLKEPFEIEKDLQLPQFTMVGCTMTDCSQNYTAGAFPCLEIKFHLRRDIGYFLIQVYVPSILIVILSWVSFWINVDASPARVSIGLLTVLTTTTMSGGARASLPKVSYIKAIDIWMIVCLVFVFCSLIEYAVVNVLARQPARAARRWRRDTSGKKETFVQVGLGSPDRPVVSAAASDTGPVLHADSLEQKIRKKLHERTRHEEDSTTSRFGSATGSQKDASNPSSVAVTAPPLLPDGKFYARRVDKISRRCFPLAFVLFNFVYWLVYRPGGETHNQCGIIS